MESEGGFGMKNHFVRTAAKGLIVGGTMLVPGVSGGTMAMILGIYDRLVTSVSSFMKHKRASFLFLALFSLGGITGMLIFANPLLVLIEKYPMPTLYFFLGAVAGGIPVILRQAQIERFSWKVPFYTSLGVLLILLFSKLPMGTFQAEADSGVMKVLLLSAVGFVAAVGLVLPGISVSYLLLLMGQYDITMKAISDFDLLILIPLAIGLLIGIVLTTKALERAMKRYPQTTYLMIFGFVAGSIVEVFPGVPVGMGLPLCLGLLASGFCLIRLLSRQEIKS